MSPSFFAHKPGGDLLSGFAEHKMGFSAQDEPQAEAGQDDYLQATQDPEAEFSAVTSYLEVYDDDNTWPTLADAASSQAQGRE